MSNTTSYSKSELTAHIQATAEFSDVNKQVLLREIDSYPESMSPADLARFVGFLDELVAAQRTVLGYFQEAADELTSDESEGKVKSANAITNLTKKISKN